jgi:hypothetical protein
MRQPTLGGMVKSFWQTMKFLLTQKKYDKVFFLMERAELLEIYRQDQSSKKILFLNQEQEKVYHDGDEISSDFLSLIRFICRKISYRIFYKKYRDIAITLDIPPINRYIQDAFGDALFLKLLSLILSRKNQKIYTGAVVPIGEKFLNSLNSYEVQHGIIHKTHIGYIGLPKIKNTLILYSDRYKMPMRQWGYKGKLIVNNYKKAFFEKKSLRHFPIVIYTQPTLEMQKAINIFMQTKQPKDVYVQRHPKDYFEYKIDQNLFVSATTPFEVACPIMYVSSIMENFTQYDKTCYIYDLKLKNLNLQDFIDLYTVGTEAKVVIGESLSDIYDIIQKEMVCLK